MTAPIGHPAGADRLARIHAEFRRHRPLDVDTNFFEGGFSSAMLTEVLAGLRGLGLELTLTDLYRYPTVRQITQACAPPATSTVPWLRARDGSGPS
jgi:aryl carrier-like protein